MGTYHFVQAAQKASKEREHLIRGLGFCGGTANAKQLRSGVSGLPEEWGRGGGLGTEQRWWQCWGGGGWEA